MVKLATDVTDQECDLYLYSTFHVAQDFTQTREVESFTPHRLGAGARRLPDSQKTTIVQTAIYGQIWAKMIELKKAKQPEMQLHVVVVCT